MARALTTRLLESIKPGKDRIEKPDGLLRGLYFIVQPEPSGTKSWAVRYRHGGRTRKYTIGPYPRFDLKAAREAGAKALRQVSEGRDPSLEKKQALALESDSVEAVVRQFIERHCKRYYRPRTLRDTQRYVAKYIVPKWGGRAIGEITRREVRDMLDKVIEGGSPVTANRLHSITRKLFSWAVEHEIIPISPITGLKRPAPEQSRERILDDDELAAVWQAAGKMGWPCGALTQLLVLTGQRRGEVAGMEWRELDLKRGLWTLPGSRTKNGRTHEVPLSPQATAIIERLPRVADSPLVFSLNGGTTPNNWTRHKGQLDKASGVTNWTLHDLRRTTASGLARLGVDLPVIEKVLNHVSGSFAGIVSIYQRHDYSGEKRKALQQWADHVFEIAEAPR